MISKNPCSLIFLFLVSLASLFSATPERTVMVQVDRLDFAEKKCEGCKVHNIILNPDTYCVVMIQCEGKPVMIKVTPHWEGDSIQLSLTSVTRKDEVFSDQETKRVLLKQRESQELTVDGFKYLVTAREATHDEVYGPPKKDPQKP